MKRSHHRSSGETQPHQVGRTSQPVPSGESTYDEITGKPLYHYTTRSRLIGILDAGEIKPTTVGVFPPELPAAWLSTATDWENTATSAIMVQGVRKTATLAEMVECDGCLVRIQIHPQRVRLIPPAKFRECLKVSKQMLTSLVKVAQESGSKPHQWRAVAGPIPLDAFVGVETAVETNPIVWTPVENWKSGGLGSGSTSAHPSAQSFDSPGGPLPNMEEQPGFRATIEVMKTPAFIEIIKKVDVVLTFPTSPEWNPQIAYGKRTFERIASGDSIVSLHTAKLLIDWTTQEPEHLIALLRHYRGECDFS